MTLTRVYYLQASYGQKSWIRFYRSSKVGDVVAEHLAETTGSGNPAAYRLQSARTAQE